MGKGNWKKSWVSISLHITAILVAGSALLVSSRSCSVAEQASNDIRAIERLDLEPLISFDMEFRQIKKYPPHLVLTNLGPIDAVQVSIQLVAMRYDSLKNIIRIRTFGSEVQWSISKLEVMQPKYFTIPQHWVETNSRIAEPPEHNVIEACIVYRRDPDRKIYGRRALYFINPEGMWVSERDQSINSERYADIIASAHASEPCITIMEKSRVKPGDLLHEFDPIPGTHDN